MKDPNDRKTVDGFADLVTQLDESPPLKKAGRKPVGERALTPAEKQKAYRLRQKQKKLEHDVRLLEIRTGKPVRSDIIDLDTSFADVYRTTRKPQ
jgi:hypothetical protein